MPEEKQFQPHELRVIEERNELETKYAKLNLFIDGNIFSKMPSKD
jgi:hypothetical protein